MGERAESARQGLMTLLAQGPATLRELSKLASLTEKEVADHLPHIEKSAKRTRQKLNIEPACCHKCAFCFEQRKRAKTPSRCPKCKSERIQPARFELIDR